MAHLREVHVPRSGKPHTCSDCGWAQFATKLLLHGHIYKKKRKRKMEYICEICQQEFRTARLLGNHKWEEHRIQKPIQCSLCDARFSTRESLYSHQDIVHSGMIYFLHFFAVCS